MGKTAALGLKLLWTMGCPPTKVNTQTTHSCPSPKHAYTFTNTHTVQIQLCPYFLFLTCLQGFWFVRIFGNVSPIYFFFNGRLNFVLLLIFLSPTCPPALQAYSAHTFLLPTWPLTQSFEDICTTISLNLNTFCSTRVVISASCM